MNIGERNYIWARMLVGALHDRGIDQFVICPGSRSSSLVLALSEEKGITLTVHGDERGAGYFAVGYARATGKAAAVVTTSGTAAVNLFPAIVEASMDNLPLVAVTADRPPELHDCGANQTIEQVGMFGNYVRAHRDFPCADDLDDLNVSLQEAAQALDLALGKPHSVGPVHFNCRFREPLTPPYDSGYQVTLSPPHDNEHEVSLESVEETIPVEDLRSIIRILEKSRRGLLLIGQLRSEDERQAALELSTQLNWPTMADITSGVRVRDHRFIIHHHDLLLESERFTKNHAPDTILHVGGRVTSKRLLGFIADSRPHRYCHNSGDGILYDPVRRVTVRTSFDNVAFCRGVIEGLQSTKPESSWLKDWIGAAETAESKIEKMSEGLSSLTEPQLAVTLAQNINNRSALFLASSMPVRDMDAFGKFKNPLSVASNRGASGIDGTIASACGYTACLNQTVTLLIGDQAFLHDLSSLSLVRQSKSPIVIVVVNNNGGRIFESLSISEHRQKLEPLFVAPHDLTLRQFAEGFNLSHVTVQTRREFEEAYRDAVSSVHSRVIEAIIDPAASREHRLKLIEAVKKEVDQCLS